MNKFKLCFFIIQIYFMSLGLISMNPDDFNNLVQLKPKEGGCVIISSSEANISKIIVSMREDLGDKVFFTEEIPFPHIDRVTLIALAKSLRALKVMQDNGETYAYKPLRKIIETSIPDLNEKTISEFLKAAFYLDLHMLYKPSVAIWSDLFIDKKQSPAEVAQAVLAFRNKLRFFGENRELPEELDNLFNEYFTWIKDPTKNLRVRTIELHNKISDITLANAKLYVVLPDSRAIQPVDTVTLELKAPIKIDGRPQHIVTADNKLYVGNSSGHNILIIDVTTNKIIDQINAGDGSKIGPLDCGVGVLTIRDKKLYVANSKYKKILIIDLVSHEIIGKPIDVQRKIIKADAIDSEFYALTDRYLLLLDIKTGKKSDFIKSVQIPALALANFGIFGNKIYLLSQEAKPIYIFDTKTREIVEEPMAYPRHKPLSLIDNGDMISILCQGGIVEFLDNTTGKREKIFDIKLPYAADALFVSGDSLYAYAHKAGTITQIKGPATYYSK